MTGTVTITLKASTVGAWNAATGNMFHWIIVRGEKECICESLVVLIRLKVQRLVPWPCLVLEEFGTRRFGLGWIATCTIQAMNNFVNIISLDLVLRVSKSGQFSDTNMTARDQAGIDPSTARPPVLGLGFIHVIYPSLAWILIIILKPFCSIIIHVLLTKYLTRWWW